jgi:thiosulfate dehydrogenase (quinone) large subunit
MRQFIPPRPLWLQGSSLALIRVAMGFLWLTNLSWKLPPSFDCDPGEGMGLCYWMQEMVDHSQLGLHARFVESIALPHYQVFGYLVVGMEAVTGLLLVLGLFTRIAALLGLLQSLNLYIGLAAAPNEWVWSYAMMALLHLAILALAAGRYFGVDAVLHDRFSTVRSGASQTRLAQVGALAT